MVERPIVGKFYNVPAVQVRGWYWFSGFVPIIGPEHEDAEIIKFPHLHFHVDWRFVPQHRIDYWSHSAPWPSIVYGTVVQRTANSGETIVIGEPVRKRMKCKRELPPYPHSKAPWTKELATKFACAKLINGTCPHRGIPASAMIRDGDILTCPGHGLRWNAITGEAVPPPDQPGESQ